MASTYDLYTPQYSFTDLEILPDANSNVAPMNEDDWETFNMQCNIALLSLLNNQRQSRNAMMTPPAYSEDYDYYPDLLSDSSPSPISSTTMTPSNSPQYANARPIPSSQHTVYRETETSAYKPKRVAELARSPRQKTSKSSNSSSDRASQKRKTSSVGGTDHYSKYIKHQQK